MKKILLLAVAGMLAIGANAQLVRSSAPRAAFNKQMVTEKPSAVKLYNEMRTPGTPVVKKAPNKAPDMEPYYRRPAGAFSGLLVIDQGEYVGGYNAPILMLKPYVEYTYVPYIDGNPTDIHMWDYWKYGIDPETGEQGYVVYCTPDYEDVPELSVTYSWEVPDAPILYVNDFDNQYRFKNAQDNVAGWIFSSPTAYDITGADELALSSKSMIRGGRYGDQDYLFTTYYGAEPLPGRDKGYWFGKNGSVTVDTCKYALNGLGQAFEKPTHPYLLKQVVLYCSDIEVKAPVEMTCKVYKLSEIQDYMDDDEVVLPEEPGELIAYGKATVTAETEEASGGVIIFTLYGEEDGLEYEVTPTIEDAILVCVDGYNDASMSDLENFAAYIASDDMVDEGYGELAYLKYGSKNSEGGVDQYYWRGLNNFFSSGKMLTGLSIFITADYPFMTFNYTIEDGEYTFPAEGGLMEKYIGYDPDEGVDVYTRSIEFFCQTPSADDGWYLSCNGDDVPEWLNIELTDEEEDGEFTGLVNAEVTAEALPDGVSYREAVVRFEIPGAYLDYKFMQGEKPAGLTGDVNGDGEVNIADVNAVIDMILSGNSDPVGDVNGDGEVNIADVNAIIDIILK